MFINVCVYASYYIRVYVRITISIKYLIYKTVSSVSCSLSITPLIIRNKSMPSSTTLTCTERLSSYESESVVVSLTPSIIEFSTNVHNLSHDSGVSCFLLAEKLSYAS